MVTSNVTENVVNNTLTVEYNIDDIEYVTTSEIKSLRTGGGDKNILPNNTKFVNKLKQYYQITGGDDGSVTKFKSHLSGVDFEEAWILICMIPLRKANIHDRIVMWRQIHRFDRFDSTGTSNY